MASTTKQTPHWLAAGQRVAVLTNHRGSWAGIEVRTITDVSARSVKFSEGRALSLTRAMFNADDIRLNALTPNATWVVPASSKFHRAALITLTAGDALRDADGARNVLTEAGSAKAARSAADALEIAARQLREAAAAIDQYEEV